MELTWAWSYAVQLFVLFNFILFSLGAWVEVGDCAMTKSFPNDYYAPPCRPVSPCPWPFMCLSALRGLS